MKLVFYGGGYAEENCELDQLHILLTKKENPRITFIPSSSYDGEYEYFDFVKQYKSYGVGRFLYFPIDIPFDQTMLNEILKSDIIFLGGGNTYYFLKHLRKNMMLRRLKDFVLRGGVLSGLSAGAIIMTPNIMTASYPSFDHDDNDENLKNLKSLDLVQFEFFPHYRNSKRYDKELLHQSKMTVFPIIASPDGHGVILENGSLTFHKKNYIFHQGKKLIIN